MNYVGSRSTKMINILFRDNFMNLFDTLNNFDSYSPITIFSRFDKPSIPFFRSECWFVLGFLECFFILNYLFCPFVVFRYKIFILFIPNLLDMECHWNILKRVHLFSFIIVLYIVFEVPSCSWREPSYLRDSSYFPDGYASQYYWIYCEYFWSFID